MSELDQVLGDPVQPPTSDRDTTELQRTEEALRKDRMLLEAIHHAQTQFILAEDPLSVFGKFLQSLLTLTDSEYGFIDEMFYTDDGRPYLTARAISMSEKYDKYNTYDVLPNGDGIWGLVAKQALSFCMTDEQLKSHSA